MPHKKSWLRAKNSSIYKTSFEKSLLPIINKKFIELGGNNKIRNID